MRPEPRQLLERLDGREVQRGRVAVFEIHDQMPERRVRVLARVAPDRGQDVRRGSEEDVASQLQYLREVDALFRGGQAAEAGRGGAAANDVDLPRRWRRLK